MTPHLSCWVAKMGESTLTAAASHTDPGRASATGQHKHRAFQIREFETYFGFIATLEDALLVIEATINGSLPHFTGTASELNLVPFRSGTVIVVAESSAKVRRWKDGVPWSPSRAFGPFVLYRQIELESSITPSHHPKYTARRFNSNHAGLEPNYTRTTLKPGTRISPTGLTKRTITLVGSDGGRHRLVSYYAPSDIIDLREGKKVHARHLKSGLPEKDKALKIPSDDPGLNGMLGNLAFHTVLAANRKSGALTFSGALRLPGIAEMLQEATPAIQKNLLLRLDNAELDQALVQELRLVKPNNPSPIRRPKHEYYTYTVKGHHHPYHPSWVVPPLDSYPYAYCSHAACPPAHHPSRAFHPVAECGTLTCPFQLGSNRGF
ncbi:Gti1/Pac2 family-domain-containing protein [Chytriomyces cf. hyalinus JEL632]|nr:Gti1/Pac2 family-domain-containing protein [Chytriomyces cf. hyalinus JEL632]